MICTHAALLVQPLKEETIQDECLGHLQQFHVFCLIIAEGFKEELEAVTSADALKLLNFYTNYRKDIITPGTELYRLKQEYDENPTIQLRRKK